MMIRKIFRAIIVTLAVLAAIFVLGRGAAFFSRSVPLVGGAEIGVVRISGVILSSRRPIRQIRSLARDPRIKAIVLRINSPGGAVVPSQDIYEEVLKVRKKGKPVIASIGTVGASGAYYIASACDKILASSGSLTGSIGVIMELAEFQDLMKKIGVQSEVMKSGALKDAGSPFRPMTPEERAYLQSVLDEMHQQFIQDVAEGRHISVAVLKPLADGRVFTGRSAISNHLVDQLGDYQDAVAEATKMAHISGSPVIRTFHEKSFLDKMVSSQINQLWETVEQQPAGFWSILPGHVVLR
ncbi:MAG: signal peptide peptidase SppA [Nitrospirae bacterium]|nr:signal peptide peptidase SppA [Nitrospirota bacterium]MCL5285610.1 signal peptide peptidase SppA [Nitrospirota bacterium]